LGNNSGFWLQPRAGVAAYEFWWGMEQLGQMARSKSKPQQMQATFKSTGGGGHWLFERQDGFPARFLIYSQNQIVGSFSGSSERRGTLELHGHLFLWSYTPMWLNRWQWNTANGKPLLYLEMNLKLRQRDGEVQLTEYEIPTEHRSLFICLGWYLLIHNARDGVGTLE
jgi:hypothetical protein